MLRVMGVMLLALGWACTAHAGEHYREVWNPPEARHAPHGSHHTALRRPVAHRLLAKHTTKHSTKPRPSRITASATRSQKRMHEGRSVSVSAAPRVEILPPLLTPEGNILRVDARAARPEIMR